MSSASIEAIPNRWTPVATRIHSPATTNGSANHTLARRAAVKLAQAVAAINCASPG